MDRAAGHWAGGGGWGVGGTRCPWSGFSEILASCSPGADSASRQRRGNFLSNNGKDRPDPVWSRQGRACCSQGRFASLSALTCTGSGDTACGGRLPKPQAGPPAPELRQPRSGARSPEPGDGAWLAAAAQSGAGNRAARPPGARSSSERRVRFQTRDDADIPADEKCLLQITKARKGTVTGRFEALGW